MPTGPNPPRVQRRFDRGGRTMSGRVDSSHKTLSAVIVWSLVFGGAFAAVLALSAGARAGTCDQVGCVITQTWTITTTQVCTGILYTVDATININSGGSLTLSNGGLSFAKDTAHQTYAKLRPPLLSVRLPPELM